MHTRRFGAIAVFLSATTASWAPSQPTESDRAASAAVATKFLAECSGGNAESCHLAATLYAGGQGLPPNEGLAAALYEKACDGGVFEACAALGVMYAEGRGVRKDSSEAASLCRKACSGGSAAGCLNLGVLYLIGAGVPRDASMAAVLFKKACDGNLGEGCHRLGVMYSQGLGVEQDETRAAAYKSQAARMQRAADDEEDSSSRSLEVFLSRPRWLLLSPDLIGALSERLSREQAEAFVLLFEETGAFAELEELQQGVLSLGVEWALSDIASTLLLRTSTDPTRQRQACELALSLKPRYVPAYRVLAQLAFNGGDCIEAIRWADKVLVFTPDPRSPDIWEQMIDDSGVLPEMRSSMQDIKAQCAARRSGEDGGGH